MSSPSPCMRQSQQHAQPQEQRQSFDTAAGPQPMQGTGRIFGSGPVPVQPNVFTPHQEQPQFPFRGFSFGQPTDIAASSPLQSGDDGRLSQSTNLGRSPTAAAAAARAYGQSSPVGQSAVGADLFGQRSQPPPVAISAADLLGQPPPTASMPRAGTTRFDTSSRAHAASAPLFGHPPSEPFGQSSSQSYGTSSSFPPGRSSTYGPSSRGVDGVPIGGFSYGDTTVRSASPAAAATAASSSPAGPAPTLFVSPNGTMHENTTTRCTDCPPAAAVGTKRAAFKTTHLEDGSRNFYSHSITAMPEYRDTSFEELRIEDYLTGNRGSQGEQREAKADESSSTLTPPRKTVDLESMEGRLKDLVEDFRNVKLELEKKDDGMRCVLCLSQPKCTVLTPCMHLCLCKECANHALMVACPLCRKEIVNKLQVFL